MFNMNISTKFRLHPPYGFKDDFWIFFRKFSLLVALQPIKFSGLDKIHMVGRELLKELFYKIFVKISAVR